MKFSVVSAAFSILAIVNAAPLQRAFTDVDVLNYALTLEHLEHAFYQGALSKFDARAFQKAGYAPWVRGRYQQIAEHERIHVEFLETALSGGGATAVKPCQYSFPYTDVTGFIQLSIALESVGASAYNGGAAAITNKGYLTAAASILAIEARHAAWINAAARKQNPWNAAFETPLSPSQVFSLAKSFIVSCPSENPSLPVNAFAPLAVSNSAPGNRAVLDFAVPEENKNGQLYAAFLSGTQTIFQELRSGHKGGEVTVPAGLIGNVYILITSSDKVLDDTTTIAGPTFAMFGFDSAGKLIQQ